MDFKDLTRILRRRWRTVIAVMALALLAAAVGSITAVRVYQSTARVFISTNITSASEAFTASAFASGRVASYAILATSSDVLDRTIKTTGSPLTSGELASKVVATVPTNTAIIEISVQDPSPRTAQQLAEAEAEQLANYIGEVETVQADHGPPIKATVTDQAQLDLVPVSPRSKLNLAIAALLGLLVGITLAIVRDVFDTTIKSNADIEGVTQAPILAHIAFDPSIPKKPLITEVGSHSARAESFRLLRTNLQFVDLDAAPRSFVVTSSLPGEGKTSTATNLAMTLAQTGKRVVLVDADLRRPRIGEVLGLETTVGFTTVLVGRSSLKDSIQHHADSGIDVLTSGPLPPNPTEILQANATTALLQTLENTYDAVVVDAPPLLPVADAAILANAVGGAIIVVRHGSTGKEQLQHALARMDHVGARTFGILVNMSPKRRGRGLGDSYGYGYGYGYGDDPETDTPIASLGA